MKFLIRASVSILVGLILSVASAALIDISKYPNPIDRVFIMLVPALALAYLYFIFQKHIQPAPIRIHIFFAATALLSAGCLSAPRFTAPVDVLNALALAILIHALLIPAIPFIKKADISPLRYFLAFTLSLVFSYGAIGFIDQVLQTPFAVFLFSIIAIPITTRSGYYLLQRAKHSLQNGFLHQPLNLILCLILPLFFIVILLGSAQFPQMFLWEYITISEKLTSVYFASALIAGIWEIPLITFSIQKNMPQQTNLAGIYAGGMFFLINLIIARALNHPAFSYNSVLFETDAGPWMSILGSPQSDAINRAVHPLVLITTRPLIRLLGMFMGEHWNLAPIIFVALLSGLCVFMTWLFVKRATQADTYSFLFAILLGSTSTHLLFGALTENYIFGAAALIFFFLLIQAKETRLAVLVPAGILVFGITITNIAQTAIGLFFNKFGFRKTVLYCFLVISFGVALTVFVNVLYPNAQTFFFVPADLAFEGNFTKPVAESPLENLKEKSIVLTRTMFLYAIVAPDPLIVVSQKKNDPFPTIDLKTFDWRDHKLASYKGWQNVPLVVWLILLLGAFGLFVKNIRATPHLPLMLGLLGNLGFNAVMHMKYGTELFLYTPYWTYALIFFMALAYAELAKKRWFEILLGIFTILLMVNNSAFVFVILHALEPFFGVK